MASVGGTTAGGSDGSGTQRARAEGNKGGRGGRGGRGRGRGDSSARGGGGGAKQRGKGRGGSNAQAGDIPAAPAADAQAKPAPAGGDDADDDADNEVCFICANPVTHISIAPCNHITCHICALRMRALYKNKDCPHCRTAAPFVIFTDDANKRFDEYTSSDISSADENIGIRYTNEDIVGDTVLLLRYNCPDASCDYAGLGWPDLHRHTRSAHNKRMCDLCTRNKKVFTHEHELFSDKGVGDHMRNGDDKPGAENQSGFRGHPLCAFCGERFYDDDKLYEHCRHKHERCFICDRRDSRQPHYYRDYNALEKHFGDDHFLCADRECLEKKFVVFDSEMDLKAHQLSEHSNSLSKDLRRDARQVDMAGFDIRPSYQQERRGGGGGGSGGGRDGRDGGREGRGRGRDPNAEPIPASTAQPMRRDEIAFQRQMAIHSAQSITSRTFGGQLTTPGSSQNPAPSRAAGGGGGASTGVGRGQGGGAPPADALATLSFTGVTNLTPQDHARLARHGAVIERASNLLGNDAAKMTKFREDISSYKQGSLSAGQLVDGFFALFNDTSSNALGTLVREVSDLFEDKAKGDALRKAWQDWRAINEDYPSLPGLGGMHGATSPSSGWAGAVGASPLMLGGATVTQQQRHTTRVLKLKNSTRRGSSSSAGSSAPSMGGSNAPSVPGATWVAGSSNSRAGRPQTTSSAAFPALPSGNKSGASKTPAQPSWIGGTSSSASMASTSNAPRPIARTAATAVGGGGSGGGGGSSRPPAGGQEFPALPAAPKPLTTIFGYGTGAVRRDLGGSMNTGFSWGAGSGESSAQNGGGDGEADAGGAGGGKKKKQGKKQVLVQWG
ncbi:hypothetical protein RB593_009700 [Gaeumannomyces tritici]